MPPEAFSMAYLINPSQEENHHKSLSDCWSKKLNKRAELPFILGNKYRSRGDLTHAR
jgi:hypothetical protein